MRFPIFLGLVTGLISGCGDDGDGSNADAPPVHAPPRIISGGGIGDGPIDGVANVYVIDDATRMPISGATVRVGTVEGTTDAAGLFVAEGVTGPQTLVVKAAGHRTDMWVGANGTNMTFNLETATEPVAPAATIAGTVDLASITLAGGHIKVAQVFYSQTDDIGDAANEIATAGDTNVCFTTPCNYAIKTRIGKVSLLAAIYDRDTKNTQNPADDTSTLIGWAAKTGLTVTGGVDQSGVTLTLIDVGMLTTATVDFGTPPAGHNTVGALIGIELAADEVFMIPLFRIPTDTTLLVPKLAAFPSSKYRLIGVANTGSTPTTTESIVLRRSLTTLTLAAGTWLAPPTNTTVTRMGASWSPVPGASVHSVEFEQGTAKLLTVTVFDPTTEITLPDLVTIPAGAVSVKVNAIGAPGLDVTSFALDDDSAKLAMVSSQRVLLP